MKTAVRARFLAGAFGGLMAFGGFFSLAQEKKEKPKREYIEATADGTSTQMGRRVSVIITIEGYSTPEDQKILLEAFDKGGSEGLLDAVSKMKSKGRIAIPGTLGYDLTYIREFKTAEGRKIRFVTDRPITFTEARNSTRSKDYSLSGGEINLSPVKDKSAGILAPACQFKIEKKTNELQLEFYQNPWKLINIRYSK